MGKFKVGDKVCILKNAKYNHSIDAIGKIIEVDESDSVIPYNVDVDGKDGWYKVDEIKLAPSKKTTHHSTRRKSNKAG